VSATPLRAEAEVLENRTEGGGNHRLLLGVPGFAGFAPGQFAMLSPGAVGAAERCDPLLPRPMAIYRARPSQRADCAEIEILYKVHGRGTALMAQARPGERVGFVGPLGRSFPDPPRESLALLVGGGTGIASLYALAARTLASGAARVRVLLGARGRSDLMGREDFEALGVALVVATEDGSLGVTGYVTVPLESMLAEEPSALVYACGPTPMMRRAAALAAQHGRRCWVSLENPMACGFGVCLGCAAPKLGGGFALVCSDGPVLDASTVDWERLSG
jgi:dihydroorotate dehydrogenase electron transfer subunit